MKANSLVKTIELRDDEGHVVGAKEVVTYQGLLNKAHEEGLSDVSTELIQAPDKGNGAAAIVKAVVTTEKGQFTGIGDASPDNVDLFIVPHLIRVAETRAKARAIRDAVNIGIVALEELSGEIGDLGPITKDDKGSRKRSKNNGPMTEAQRRYLFRLLAMQGLEGDEAQENLKEAFEVKDLKEVTKTQASAVIDKLLVETGGGGNA